MSGNDFNQPKPPLAYLLEQVSLEREDHFEFPFPQKRVWYLGRQLTPHSMLTRLEHGPPKPGQVPVRLCGVYGCINGKHHKWGSQSECNRTRGLDSRKGAGNPNAKLSALLVAQIRSIKWRGGYYRWHVADVLGISMRTLAMAVNGQTWKGIKPYKNAAEWAARNAKEDEF